MESGLGIYSKRIGETASLSAWHTLGFGRVSVVFEGESRDIPACFELVFVK